jgi:HEAT repeat protein/ATP/ADP translocase
MKQKKFWLQTLNIRPDEGWLVKKLFFLQFFQGAGIAFFFTASFALFLTRFTITELPWVFIYSSILLWATGFIYSKIEHHFAISKLAVIITIFMAVSMLLFRLAFIYLSSGWFLYWMMAWFNVLYLLNNLEFWGLSSLLFDARQSKRLLGVISAGDIPAKFIGYSLALLTVHYIGTINLLWVGIACMLASLPFLISIRKSGILHEGHHHHKHIQPKHHKTGTDNVKKIVSNFSGNTLIRRLSFLSIIITGSFIITNFAFYAGVKDAFHDDVSLAKFIALFLAVVRIIALVVKMIFTGRLINNLGIIKSLLITPVAMLVLITVIVLTQDLPGYQKLIIYLFGSTAIVVDILRSAISTPVFLTIMQPLPNHDRLRAHTIVKGIMDPFASLLTGILLLTLIHYQHQVNLLTLSYILLFICVLWMIGIYRINSSYLKMVVKTLSNRYFNQDDFSVMDSGTTDWLKEKIKTSAETEAINILNMLYKEGEKISPDLIQTALDHPSENVQFAALKMMHFKAYPEAVELLVPLLKNNRSIPVMSEIIKLLCRNGVENAIIMPYTESESADIKQAALEGLFYYGNDESKTHIGYLLKTMSASVKTADRMIVAGILNDHSNKKEVEMIHQLMDDTEPSVRKLAFLAAGKSGNHQLLQQLIHKINSDENDVITALYIAGEHSIPYIAAFLRNEKCTPLQNEKLIFLLGRIGGSANKILLELLQEKPQATGLLVKALYRSNFHPKPGGQEIFYLAAKNMLQQSALLIYMQSSLQKQADQYSLLINSFELELQTLREGLLNVFAILYGHAHINQVRTAYAAGKKETIINAMEIIDITVRKDIAIAFNTIFEPGNISERMQDLRKYYPPEFFNDAAAVLTRVLAEGVKHYNNWTTSCTLYTTKKQAQKVEMQLVNKFIADENIMVKETALYAAGD